MRYLFSKLKLNNFENNSKSFWICENGIAALEFAIIAPALLLIISGIFQLSAFMFIQNHMTSVAHDTARRVAVGEWTETESENEALNALVNWGINYTIDTTLTTNAFDGSKVDITVDISAPMSDIALLDIFGLFNSGNLTAGVSQLSE